MNSFGDLIRLWPSAEALADDLGLRGVTVRQWGNRNSIPASYWPDMIDSAARRQIDGVTLTAIAEIATRATPRAGKVAA